MSQFSDLIMQSIFSAGLKIPHRIKLSNRHISNQTELLEDVFDAWKMVDSSKNVLSSYLERHDQAVKQTLQKQENSLRSAVMYACGFDAESASKIDIMIEIALNEDSPSRGVFLLFYTRSLGESVRYKLLNPVDVK
jgi:hypothetical protein